MKFRSVISISGRRRREREKGRDGIEIAKKCEGREEREELATR